MAWITPIQTELRRTGDILSGGLREIGADSIRREELGLKRAMAEDQIMRQREQDALRRPGLQLQAEQAKMELEHLNQPVTIGTMFPDDKALVYATYAPEGETESLAEKIGGLFGARIDVQEGSPTYGKYVKDDGSVVTNKDLMIQAKPLKDLILANTDPVQTVTDQMTRYIEKLQSLPEGHEQIPAVQENLKKSIEWLDNKDAQVRTLNNQIRYLSRLPGPEFEKSVARLTAERDAIQAAAAKEVADRKAHALKMREKAYDRDTELMKQERADRRAENKAWLDRQPKPEKPGATREIKVGNEIHTQEWDGWKWQTIATGEGRAEQAPKLSDQQKASLKLLTDEAASIFKGLHEGTLMNPEEIAAKEKKLLEIKKKIENFGIDVVEGGGGPDDSDPLNLFGDKGKPAQGKPKAEPAKESGEKPVKPQEDTTPTEAQRYRQYMGNSPDVLGTMRATVGPRRKTQELTDLYNWIMSPRRNEMFR